MRDIEESGITIGYLAGEPEKFLIYCAGGDRSFDARQKRDGGLGPHAPVAKKAAGNPYPCRSSAPRQYIRGDQIEKDIVVVAGIEGNAIFGSSGDHAFYDIERSIAIEWRDLDRHYFLELGKSTPKGF